MVCGACGSGISAEEKYKPLKDVDRNLKIEDWFNNRERKSLVDGEKFKMSTGEIAKDTLGSWNKSKKVYEIIKDLK